MKNLFKSIISFFLITLIILNLDLNAYAYAKTKNFTSEWVITYQLSLEQKNNFFNTNIDTNLISISNNENNSKNSNLWMLSFIYPGLGQMFMNEFGLGAFFATIPIIIIGVTIFFFIDFYKSIQNGAVSFIPAEILIGLPSFLLLFINYVSNIINAYSLSQKTSDVNKEKNYVEKEFPYLWMSSIIVPGSGQVFSGELLKGLGFFVLELAVLFSGFIVASMSLLHIGIFAYTPFILFHIWNVYDSYNEFSNNSDMIKNEDNLDPSLFVKNNLFNYSSKLTKDFSNNIDKDSKIFNVKVLVYNTSF